MYQVPGGTYVDRVGRFLVSQSPPIRRRVDLVCGDGCGEGSTAGERRSIGSRRLSGDGWVRIG